MNQALAFSAIRTVPGFPLGQPVDGRERYGMTAEQAHAYCWLVKNRPHDKPFCLNFRDPAWSLIGILAALTLLSAHLWNAAGYKK
jgi:hypothetical protein